MFLFQPKKLTKYFSSGTGEIVGIFSLFFSQNLSGAGGVMTVYHQTGCDIGNMWGRTVDRRNPAKVDTEKHLFLLGFAYLNWCRISSIMRMGMLWDALAAFWLSISFVFFWLYIIIYIYYICVYIQDRGFFQECQGFWDYDWNCQFFPCKKPHCKSFFCANQHGISCEHNSQAPAGTGIQDYCSQLRFYGWLTQETIPLLVL